MFYTDKSTDIGNQVEVDPDDTYRSNGKKNLAELHRIRNQKVYEHVDWFLFCDDDTCVNLGRLEKLLPKLDQDKMYGSILRGTWPHDKSLCYLSGGAGYLISSKLISDKGVPPLNLLNVSFYSDVCVGLWARDQGIKMMDVPGFHSQSPRFYDMGDLGISECYTFHYIKELSQMQKLVSIYND